MSNGEVFRHGTNIAANKKSILKIFSSVKKLIVAIALFFVFASAAMADVVVQGSTINVDNKFYVDPSTGNVGIGMTTPATKFVVDESSQATWKGLFSFQGTLLSLKEQNSANNPYPYIEWRDSLGTRAAYLGWGSKIAPKHLDFVLENGHNLYIDGGNVGIGTTSPTYKLDVNGAISGNNINVFGSYQAGTWDITKNPAGGVIAFGGVTASQWSTTALYTGGSERVRVTSTGNVGIGTAGPSTQLHILGSNPELRVESTGGGAQGFLKATTGTRVDFGSNNNVPVGIFANGGEKVTILTSGNVGIGTTSPGAKLQVMDTIGGITTGARFIPYHIAGVVAGLQIQGIDVDGTTYRALSLNPSGGNVGIGTTIPAQKLDVTGQIHSTGDVCTDAGGGKCLSTVSGGGGGGGGWTDAGTNVYTSTLTDNVGVGTTTPAVKFVVDESSQATWKGLFSFSGSLFQLKEQNPANNPYPYIEWRDSLGTRAAYLGWGSKIAPKYLELGLENGHNFYIGGGNVGIGTASPGAKLDVAYTAGQQGIQIIGPSGNTNIPYVDGNAYISASNIVFRDSVNVEKMRLVGSTGNVGIGTTSPASQLSVVGAGQQTGSFNTAGSLGGTIGLGDTSALAGAGGAILFSAFSQAWKFASIKGYVTNGGGNSQGDIVFSTRRASTDATLTETMRITASGNVGIGTTNPAQKLDVVGQIHSTGDICTDAGGGKCLSTVSGGGGGGWTDAGTNVYTSTLTDNVGIGTTAPGYLLDVNQGFAHFTYNTQSVPPSSSGLAVGWNYDAGWAEVDFYNVYDNAGRSFAFSQKTGAGTANRLMTIMGNGNVGIGTTSPTAPLHVSSVAGTVATFQSSNSGGPVISFHDGTTNFGNIGGALGLLGTDTKDTMLVSSSNGKPLIIRAAPGQTIDTRIGPTSAIYIASTGNVGIGTISPGKKLQIQDTSAGALTFPLKVVNTGAISGTAAGMMFTVDDDAAAARGKGALVYERDSQGWNRGDFHFLQNTVGDATNPTLSNAVMTIKNSGNVGIGTASPGAKLHVAYTAGQQGIQITGPSGNTHIPYIDGNAYISASNIVFRDSVNVEKMRLVGSTGNVGIGTTTPGADKLDVRGRAYASGGWQTTDADYAEWFEKEESTEPGDLIGINLVTGKARKYRPSDYFVGIHSSNPAFVGNRLEETDAEMSKTHVLVGLVGQLYFDKSQTATEGRIVKTIDGKEVGVLLSNDKVLIHG